MVVVSVLLQAIVLIVIMSVGLQAVQLYCMSLVSVILRTPTYGSDGESGVSSTHV